jgi:hypothetical protein
MNDARIGSPSLSTKARILRPFTCLLTGVVTHVVVSTAPFSSDLSDWLSRTADDRLASRPIRSPSPYAVRPRSPPRRITLELAKECCRPSSPAESCRGADSATGSRCAANREWRSCRPHVGLTRSHARRRLGDQRLPAAPTPHPSDHSNSSRPLADEADGAPPSTSLSATRSARNPESRNGCNATNFCAQLNRSFCLYSLLPHSPICSSAPRRRASWKANRKAKAPSVT